MNREMWKVFFAAALGAGVGSLIALEVSVMFWWIGLIAGGITGYLSYEWRKVLAAIPAAYRAAVSVSLHRRRMPYFWRTVGCFVAIWTNILFLVEGTVFMSIYLACLFFKGHNVDIGDGLLSDLARSLMMAHIFFTFYISIIGIRVVYFESTKYTDKGEREKNMLSMFQEGKNAFYDTLPPIFLSRGIWKFFLLIHSERRLICGADAMLGAAVGFYAGSALVGAIAGGLFGAVNYVLVTEYWLKPKGFLPIRNE